MWSLLLKVEQYKAPLVAKGYSQKPHLDYTETFAPVAKFASLRAIMAIAMEDLELDSTSLPPFSMGTLKRFTCLNPALLFLAKSTTVCCLKKSLYGLKQSPRQWYAKLNDMFMKLASGGSRVITASMSGLRTLIGLRSLCLWMTSLFLLLGL